MAIVGTVATWKDTGSDDPVYNADTIIEVTDRAY